MKNVGYARGGLDTFSFDLLEIPGIHSVYRVKLKETRTNYVIFFRKYVQYKIQYSELPGCYEFIY